jgi:hypothetical protein
MILKKKLLQVDAFMRVPNKHERKSRKGTDLLSAFFFPVTVFFFFSVIFCAVFPAPVGADEGRLSITLIDGDEIYVRSGNHYSFLQGYQIYVKGADTEGNRVWIELRRDGVFLEDAIVSEGSTFVYSNNSTEILNLTVDTIYGGADGVLVRFSPVYQHLNPRLPMPQKPQLPPASSSDNNSSNPPYFGNQAEGFDVPIFFLSIGAVLLVTGVFAGMYKKK